VKQKHVFLQNETGGRPSAADTCLESNLPSEEVVASSSLLEVFSFPTCETSREDSIKKS
jgi:hypothetical protein